MKNKTRVFPKFSEFTEEHALSEELPYWDFFDDSAVVSLSDGSLVQGLKLSGIDIEAWDEARIGQLTMQLRSVLNSLPDGAEIQFQVDSTSDYLGLVKSHAALSQEASPAHFITQERVKSLEAEIENKILQKSEIKLFIYSRVESKTKNRFSFFTKQSSFQQVKKEEHEKRALELSKQCESLSDQLVSIGILCTPMPATEIRKSIFKFLNPRKSLVEGIPKQGSQHRDQEFSPEELKREPSLAIESPRSELCHSDMIVNVEGFFLDGLYHRIITLKSLPENTFSAMAARLSGLPHGTTLSFSIRVPEQSKELSTLQTKRRVAHSMSATHGGRASDLESEARLESTEELLRELIQTGQKILYGELAVLVRAETRDILDQKAKHVLSRIRELSGAEGFQESVAMLKVFKSVLPAGMTTLTRPKRMKTDNAADFLPIYEPYRGSDRPVCLFQNRMGGLVAVDPVDSSTLPNFNALVTGSSGAGKSFLSNCVLLQLMGQNPFVFVIDIGGSYRKLCEFMGGSYFEIAPPTTKDHSLLKVINPFSLSTNDREPSPQKIKFLLSLLEVMLTDQDGDKLSRLSKSVLEEAIAKTYARITDREVILSDLVETFRGSSEGALKDFSKMLYSWTGNTPYGRLLDGQGSLKFDSPFVVFDLKQLSAYEDLQSCMILIITDFILGKINSSPGAFKQIIMDECWELLKSRPASQFMEYCVRTIRKNFGGITFVTQGLEEFIQSPIGAPVLNNTAIKYILLQRGDLEPIRNILKLNDQEMNLIRSLRQNKGAYSECFMIANESRSIIRIVPTPLEYWLATSDARDNQLVEAARTQWPKFSMKEIIIELARLFPHGALGATSIPEMKPEKKSAT